jgi:ATP-dependent DNA ligase
VPATTTVVSQVFSIEERGRDLFAAVERLDLEGIVAKRKADPYRPETVWYKSKSRTYT